MNDLSQVNGIGSARFDANLKQVIADMTSDLVEWMFVLWMGNVVMTGVVVVLAYLLYS